MRAELSILGLYNWDTSIFENLSVPAGLTAADVAQHIIYDCAELEIIYPNPETMKFMIGLWSSRELPIWTRFYAATQAEYDPIENYNRSETWTDSLEEETSATTGGTSSQTTSETNTRQVAGFNSEAFTNESKNTDSGSNSITNSETGSGSRENTVTHTGSVSGNIGVTTSQQMLEQELALVGKLDIYGFIVESFKRRFCLMIY